MARCSLCGKDENMPYTCQRCGNTYCAEHRLPENHDCIGLEEWNDPDGVFDSGFDDSVDNPGRASAASTVDRLKPNLGTGGPLGYFRGNMTYVFLGLMFIVFGLQYLLFPVFGFVPGTAVWNGLFVLSPARPLYVWTWFFAVFAHGGLFHIAANAIVLYFFGPLVERRAGTRAFTALFVVSGVTAGFAQIGIGALLGDAAPVLGASGAVLAIMGVLTVLNPGLRVYLYFLIPVPLWLLTLGFAGFSVFMIGVGGAGGGGIANFAHLAGLVIGLAYGERLRRTGTDAPEQLQFGGGRGGMGGPGRGRF
jgi:membrane associated rhomboid family serine protease